MGESVHANIPEVLLAAHQIEADGHALESTMKSAVAKITGGEGPEIFPSDEFTDNFVGPSYHRPVGNTTMNTAIQNNALQMGPAMGELGKYVSGSMWTYAGTDDESGSEIAKA